MKQNYGILLAFLLLLIAACGKGIFGTVRVDGIVKDATTGEPIYNARVYLLEAEVSNDLFGPPPSWYPIDSTDTGAFGRFEFSYESRNGYIYSVYAYKFNYIENINPEMFDNDDAKNLEIELYPIAYLTIHIHNINEYDAWDHIDVSDLHESFYGNSIDTSLTIEVYGNSTETITWFIEDDEVLSPAIESDVYCPAFDTTYFEIAY